MASHTDLVAVAARWLKRQGFGVVATELRSYGTAEEPDAIGFRSAVSAVVEVKVSRADFLADKAKPHRQNGGLGNYRFYLCPPGVIEVDDLPAGWGLLYASGRRVTEVARPMGNLWPQSPSGVSKEWSAYWHPTDIQRERQVLYSVARRLASQPSRDGDNAVLRTAR